MPREILVDWQTPGAAAGLTVLYFDEATSVTSQRTALASALAELTTSLCTTSRWTIRNEGRELSDATGTVTGFWGDGTARTGTGSAGTTPVANAAQGLIRWLTPDIVAGRRIRGRSFVPGMSDNVNANGQVNATGTGDLQSCGGVLITSAVGFGIWHRPQSGTGGSFHEATAAVAWNEFAVQRGRR